MGDRGREPAGGPEAAVAAALGLDSPRMRRRPVRHPLSRRAARLRASVTRALPRARPQGRPGRRSRAARGRRRAGARARHPRAHLGDRRRAWSRLPFAEAQELAAEAWGARRTWFLVNGASQGNHVALLTLAHAGDRWSLQRNAHSSTIDALVLSGLRPDLRGAGARPRAAHRALPDARAARPRARRDAGRRRGGGRLAHLLRRGGGRGRARRGGPRARRAADRGRGVGRASRVPATSCPRTRSASARTS